MLSLGTHSLALNPPTGETSALSFNQTAGTYNWERFALSFQDLQILQRSPRQLEFYREYNPCPLSLKIEEYLPTQITELLNLGRHSARDILKFLNQHFDFNTEVTLTTQC